MGTDDPRKARNLDEIPRVLSGEFDLGEVLAALLDASIESVEAERGFILIPAGRGGKPFRVLAARSTDLEDIRRPEGKVSQFVVKRAFATGETIHVPDTGRDRRYRAADGVRPRGVLAVPVAEGSPELGIAIFDHRFRALRVDADNRLVLAEWLALAAVAIRMTMVQESSAELKQEIALLRSRLDTAASPGAPGPPRGPGSRRRGAPAVPRPRIRGGIVWVSPQITRIFDLFGAVAPSDVPVLIRGESGTGKELFARAIHTESTRSRGPFVTVNCAAIPMGLLETELFGYVRGAFTGADEDRQGLFRQADGGTLFLDEVAEMSGEMQRRILRALEKGCYRPVGGSAEERSDARIIASTNRDIEEMVSGGHFRKDLFFRLNGFELEIPPLRERREDIPPLARHFAEQFAAAEGFGVPEIGDGAMRLLLAYGWPGNVRELENEVRRLVAMRCERVGEDALSPRIRAARPAQSSAGLIRKLGDAVAEAERREIEKALVEAGGNRTRAARLLGITRKSLYRRMERYGL